MKKTIFSIEKEGFYGAWFPNKQETEKGMILMLGDDALDRMAVCGARWIHSQGCHALTMAPSKKDYGHHNYPLERFGKAIEFMKSQGCRKIGIVGASTTGMLALIAASYYPEISMTIALSPSDFVMEGFYRDGKDGMNERPGDNESTVSWEGKPLPYLPFAYRHPEYWQKIIEESKEGGDKFASKRMFDESERRHPIKEEVLIKVERIQGEIIFIGAEDDVLWDTCKYIRRMKERLFAMNGKAVCEYLLYKHGTHFVFPESLLKMMLPIGGSFLVKIMFKAGREYPAECKRTRINIDKKLRNSIQCW